MSLILFEDEHLLVINKPAGWNTHAPSPFAGEGVYDWLKNREPRWSKLAIIHRLDKETSGVLIFGKTTEANRSLTKQFASRAVRKEYWLLTDRAVKRDELTAVSTIVRVGEKYISRPAHAGASRAETRFTVVQHGKNKTLIRAEPMTGRTHQIRVHAAEHGFPILGDTPYGGTRAPGLFLHAATISFQHPVTTQPVTIQAPLSWPDDIRSESNAVPIHSFPSRIWTVDSQQTTAWRLLHGASDGWRGLYLDKLGNFLLAQTEGDLPALQRAALERLARDSGEHTVYHKQLNRNVRGASPKDVSPQLLIGRPAPDRFTILENGLRFELSFNEGYSVGLFLDQRDNRRRLLVNHIAADFPLFPAGAAGAQLLNAFAYTCGFSVAAAKAGAITTSLDLSKKYLEWGKRNFVLNGLDPSQHDFIYGDAFDWMRRLAKKQRSFDCIVLDPPTFSQSQESGVWQAEKHYGKLIEAALPLLTSGGVLFTSTNAAKLKPEDFLDTIRDAIAKTRRKTIQQHYVPQTPDFPISREEPAYLKTVWLRIG